MFVASVAVVAVFVAQGEVSAARVAVDASPAVRDALALRVAPHEIVDAPADDVYSISVTEHEGGGATVYIDYRGQAWTRRVEPGAGELPQEVAAEAVSLLGAIVESGAPTERVLVPTAPPVEPEPTAPPPEPEPEPEAPGEVRLSPLEAPAAPSRWEVEVSVMPTAIGTPRAQAMGGVGSSVGVGAVHEGGAVLRLEARAAGRRLPREFGWARLRLAVLGGYLHPLAAWELGAVAGASIEPWWPLRRGRSVSVELDDAPQRPGALFGGFLRAEASRRIGATRRVSARLGAFLECSGSASPDGGGAQLVRARPIGGQQVLGHLGGLELAGGLSLTLRVTTR